VKRPDNLGLRAFSQFISPGTIAIEQKIDPKIDAELRRLYESTGLKTHFPTGVDNFIPKTKYHPQINLTEAETKAYQKRVGELTMQAFAKTINKTTQPNSKKNLTADELK
jgi:hypothetical protein